MSTLICASLSACIEDKFSSDSRYKSLKAGPGCLPAPVVAVSQSGPESASTCPLGLSPSPFGYLARVHRRLISTVNEPIEASLQRSL